MTTPTTSQPTRELQIDFLFLDLDTCTRCRATDATLLEAIERTRPALEAAGVVARVTKTLVSNEAAAHELGFVSSPTIRSMASTSPTSWSRAPATRAARPVAVPVVSTPGTGSTEASGAPSRRWVSSSKRSCAERSAPTPPANTHQSRDPATCRRTSAGYFAAAAAATPASDCCPPGRPSRLLHARGQGRLLWQRGGVVILRLRRWALKYHECHDGRPHGAD